MVAGGARRSRPVARRLRWVEVRGHRARRCPPVKATLPPPTTLPCGDAALPAGNSLTATALNQGDLAIYDTPDPAAAPARTMANPRLINNDPNAAVPLLFLVKDTPDTNCAFIEVYLPVRPNGSTGFVKRADVEAGHQPVPHRGPAG